MLSTGTKAKIIDLYSQGYKVSEIHALLGTSRGAIKKTLIDNETYNTNNRVNQLQKEKDKEKVLELYKSGVVIEEIVEQLSIKEYLIKKYIKEEGLEVPKKKRINKSDKYADKIIELHKNGLSIYEIEKQVDLCESTVKKVLVNSGIYNINTVKVVGRKTKPSKINTDNLDSLTNIEKHHKHYDIVEANKDKVINMYSNNHTSLEISKELQVDTNLVKACLIEWDTVKIEDYKKEILKGYILEISITNLAKLAYIEKTELVNRLKEWKAYEISKEI